MRLGEVLKEWRYAKRIGMREAAKMIGLSTATLCRIENDEAVDGKTMIKLFDWLFH